MNTIYVKELLQLFIFGLFVTLMNSCEGGFVYDSNSKIPIDSVLCEAITGSEKVYSDSIGAYKVCNEFGGCMFGCKDITVRFSKVGYKTTDVAEPGNASKIYLEKE